MSDKFPEEPKRLQRSRPAQNSEGQFSDDEEFITQETLTCQVRLRRRDDDKNIKFTIIWGKQPILTTEKEEEKEEESNSRWTTPPNK
ncbi:hypothetical protein EYF80_064058 [Liparis tanakae]|uniref:Uncharacterized protein n=1 Tax=Liparis tanakae TaxID=230148 RepID=A0A4Z2EAG4_9TELE|nr:hypothetical protein EYF80_064058 [Liparis tanakae]